MIALLLAVLVGAAAPAAQDLAGSYELHLPHDTLALELSRDGEEWSAIFQRPQMPPVHAQQVTVEGRTVEIVLRVHGTSLNFRLEMSGDQVTGQYSADGGAPAAVTGRRLEKRRAGG